MADLSIDGGESFVAFEFDTITDDEAIAVEEQLGIPWLQFLNDLNAGSIRSQKALVWLMHRRENPDLAYGDVSYEVAKFQIRGADEVPLPEGVENNGAAISESSPTPSVSDPGSGSA